MTNGNLLDEEAWEKCGREVREMAARVAVIPDDAIAEVYGSGYAEDGRAFIVVLETVGGRTMIVSATPGERLRVHVERHSEKPAGALDLTKVAANDGDLTSGTGRAE